MTTNERIEQVLKNNKIVLFMKGSPESPQCGFSARAVAILTELKARLPHRGRNGRFGNSSGNKGFQPMAHNPPTLFQSKTHWRQ